MKPQLDVTKIPPMEISDDTEKEQVFLMYLQGWTAADIEAKTGIRQDKIRQWAHRGEWAAKKKRFESLRMEKNPLEQQPIVKAVINSRRGENRKKFIEHTGEMAAEDAEHWKQLSPEERLVVAPGIGTLNGVHRKNLGLENEEEGKEKGHISLTFLSSANQEGMVRVIGAEKVREIEDVAPVVSRNADDY